MDINETNLLCFNILITTSRFFSRIPIGISVKQTKLNLTLSLITSFITKVTPVSKSSVMPGTRIQKSFHYQWVKSKYKIVFTLRVWELRPRANGAVEDIHM